MLLSATRPTGWWAADCHLVCMSTACLWCIRSCTHRALFLFLWWVVHMSCSDYQKNLSSAAVLQAAPILLSTGKHAP